MTRQRLTRTAASIVLAAVGAVSLVLGSAAPAQAAPPAVLVSTDGVNFHATLPTGVFAGMGLLVPGDSLSARLYVRNPSTVPGLVRVSVDDLLTPSAAFASAVTLLSNDGEQSRSATVAELENCGIILPPDVLGAGDTMRINLTVSMRDDVVGLEAQEESAELGFRVDMRDAKAGPYPTTAGCPPGFTGSTALLAFTGVDTRTPGIAAFAAIALAGGILLLVVRRRRRREEEVVEEEETP